MTQSYLTWIPSLQRYVRFRELTTGDQKVLAKAHAFDSTDVDIEFTYALNTLLQELCCEQLDIKKLTVFDKFAIVLQITISCIGTEQKFMLKCRECDSVVKATVNLPTYLETLAPRLDKSYKKIITDDRSGISVTCDIPTIGNDYHALSYVAMQGRPDSADKQIEWHFDVAVASYVCEISAGNRPIDFVNIDFADKRLILNELPANCINKIKHEFVAGISFEPVILQRLVCGCGADNSITFSLQSLNGLIKLFLNVDSLHGLYQNLFDLSTKLGIDPTYIETMTPGERDAFKSLHNAEQKARDNQQPDRLTPEEFQPSGHSSFGQL